MVSNGASIATMFGIPAPSLSKNAKDKINSFANKMSKTCTAQQFDCLQESISDAQQLSTMTCANISCTLVKRSSTATHCNRMPGIALHTFGIALQALPSIQFF